MYTSVRQVLRHFCLEQITSFQIQMYLEMKDRKLGGQRNNLAEQRPKEFKAGLQ